MTDIRPATTPDERLAVYRFRYSVYVEEMGLAESHADHAARLITDPLDHAALVVAAWRGGHVVGTARTNLIRDGGVGDYRDHYRLGGLSAADAAATSVSTWLMVAAAVRRTPVTARLVCAVYSGWLDRGVTSDYCDCAPELVPFFTALGYRELFDDFCHPEFGPGSVLRLDVHDLGHLARVRLPFRHVLTAWRAAGAQI